MTVTLYYSLKSGRLISPVPFFFPKITLATKGTFHRARTNNSTICMEIQKTSNSQPTRLQTILQSNSHQDSMVLAQRQKYKSIEQNRKPRDESTYLWTPYL